MIFGRYLLLFHHLLSQYPNSITVDIKHSMSEVVFSYHTSLGDKGTIKVGYPFIVHKSEREMLPSIGLGVAVYLAQLCLVQEHITLDFPASASAVAAIQPLLEMLYDVRRWKDGLPLGEYPTFLYSNRTNPTSLRQKPIEKRTLLLWSGGKDSTLSLLLLRKHGYEVCPVHTTINPEVHGKEARATARLARSIGVSYQTLKITHPEFAEFSTRYAKNWNSFPLHNVVPFGRDLLLALLVAPLIRRERASHLSMGHDNECRNAFVAYQGKQFPRNDAESYQGAQALESYMRRFLLPRVSLLPPLARYPEFKILRDMMVDYPDLMSQTSFCFWGRKQNCGRCAKCLRYYLAQRVLLDKDILKFEVNPLSQGACPDLDEMLVNPIKQELLFQTAIIYCLGRLVERNYIWPEESRLQDFRVHHYEAVRSRLDDWELELTQLQGSQTGINNT